MSNKQNLFKKFHSYEESEADIFKGRDKEIDTLFNMVKSKTLIVLYGKSGIGKTSLIHAGLFPRLREAHYLPISIRLDYQSSSKSLIFQVIEKIKEELSAKNIIEMEKNRGTPAKSFKKGETLCEYFQRVEHVDSSGKEITLILVFDQFEEIFTIGKNCIGRNQLRDELHYIVENKFPPSIKNNALKLKSHFNKEASVRFLLGLRDDYLSDLNWLKKKIPSLHHLFFQIGPMDGHLAREVMAINGVFRNEAVKKDILRQFNSNGIEMGMEIQDDDLEIEPLLLSILCANVIDKEATSLSKQEKNCVLADFYEEALSKLSHSEQLEELIETRLLTEGGFRTPLYLERESSLYGMVEGGIKNRILRKVCYDKKEHVEIIHDALAQVIKERRNRRREEKRELEYKKKLRGRNTLTLFSVFVGLLFLVLAIAAHYQKKQADIQRNVAESNRVALEAGFVLPEDNLKALFIAGKAFKMSTSSPAPSVQRMLSAVAYSTYKRPFCTLNIQHKEKVSSAGVSPCGKKILTTSIDRTVRLWNLDGKLLARFNKHSGNVNSAAFAPDGNRILTASIDKTARLWDLDGNLLRVLEHHDEVWSAVFSPDGSKILTSSRNKAFVWDLEGNVLSSLIGHTNHVEKAVFSPDGTKIVTASWDKTVKLWDVSGRLLVDLNKHSDYVWSVAFSPDGSKIVSTSSDRTAKVWDLNGNLLSDLDKHTDVVSSAVFSRDGSKVFTSAGNTAKLWSLDGSLLADYNKHSNNINSISFSPGGDKILTASLDGTAKVWDLRGNLLVDLDKHRDSVKIAVFSPKGQYIVTGSGRSAKIWELNNKFVSDLYENLHNLGNAVISPNGKYILSWSGGFASLIEQNGTLVANLDKHTAAILSGAFSDDGTRVITASWDQTAIVWNLKGRFLFELKHATQVRSAFFTCDGKKILTVSQDNSIKLWDALGNFLGNLKLKIDDAEIVDYAILSPDCGQVLTWAGNFAKLWDIKGNLLAVLNKHTDKITGVAFSPDGSNILTISSDKTAKLWDLYGNLLADLKNHKDSILSAVFSPDGARILTASADKTAKIWDLTGNLLADLKKHKAEVLNAVFSPDGTRIITISMDKTVKMWYTPEAIMQWLENAPVLELSKEEKEIFCVGNYK